MVTLQLSEKYDVAMGAHGSGIYDIYFPGERGLGIHEVLYSWHVTSFN